jgi:predicted membrane protein
MTWRPTTVEQLEGTYHIDAGNAVLDLSAVDFTGRSEAVEVSVSVGDLTIIVPPTVDVKITSEVNIGNSVVFGQQWSGINQSQQTVTDNGADGPGGGALTIEATVSVGDLEVRR